MSMSDPIADYLTRIRNAIKAEKKSVDIPYSKFKANITDILLKASFINDYKVIESNNKKYLNIRFKFYQSNNVINGLKKISKPGRRVYVKAEKLPRVRNGLGIAIVSTSKGLITDKQARELGVGGEVVCYIW